MLAVRRLLFAAWLYLSIAIGGLIYIPFMVLAPSIWAIRFLGGWARLVRWGLKAIMGIELEVRGLEHRPTGAALVAAKHQSMGDVVAPFIVLNYPCFVFKKELMWTPVIGWFGLKTRMIAVDRGAHSAALRKLVVDARDRMSEDRQLVIFPEGTRTAPGEPGQYKPGIAALYRELAMPCCLIATNSGAHWPAKGIAFNPGRIVFEFLEPIPAGLKRGEFMKAMEERIEAASRALL